MITHLYLGMNLQFLLFIFPLPSANTLVNHGSWPSALDKSLLSGPCDLNNDLTAFTI